MKKLTPFKIALATFLFMCVCSSSLFAQTEEQQLEITIRHKDSLFWNAYNTCDIKTQGELLSDDVEFYHDKGGITMGREALLASLQKNLCSNPNYKLRREAVAGTVNVYPLHNAGKVYGAIISGDHQFYISESGETERLDGLAKFTQLWILKDSVWKMTRILSYSHGPAAYINKRTAILVTPKILDKYAGNYKGAQTGMMQVKRQENALALTIGDKTFMLYPQSDSSFFSKDRDLVFDFVKDKDKHTNRMVVKEFGAVAEEAVFIK